MTIAVTLLYAGLMGLLLMLLALTVTYHWVRVTGEGQSSDQVMRRAERVLGSFVEFAPLSLLLMALLEIRGAPHEVLHGLGILLSLSRLLHAYAMNQVKGAAVLRAIGAQGTYIVLAIGSLGCIYYFAFATI